MTQLIVWLNTMLNAAAKVVLAPIAVMPGWLSNTIISAVMGVVLLLAVATILGYLLSDILYAIFDPRVRLS